MVPYRDHFFDYIPQIHVIFARKHRFILYLKYIILLFPCIFNVNYCLY